jgi:hypothetical protein
MFPVYDHRDRRLSRFDVIAVWMIAGATFVAAAVWWTL